MIKLRYVMFMTYVCYDKTNVGGMSLAIPLGWIQGVLFMGTG